MHIPFSASSFGLRHMDGYPGLPAHLLHHLQPQFLHPALDPRLPFGSGAFRPLGSSPVHEGKGFASAFAPPSKCLKIETSNGTHETTLFSPGAAAEERNYMNGQPQQRSDSSSPASVSISPPNLQQVVKEESSDAPMSEDREGTATPGSVSEGTERSTPEEGRGFRRRKKLVQDPACCPVCGVTVRAGELESHFLQELDRLYKMSPAGRARRSHGPHAQHGAAANAPAGPPRPGNIGSTADGTAEGRWETYQRIKANRTSRLRIKNRKRKADEATCPVCNERFQGSVEELNLHVEHCLRKNGGVADEDENVDVEGDGETFEEYEWAGQKRVRASSLLQGGYAGAGMVTSSSRGGAGAEDEDGELVVDGDETATYGPPQYSEADVVPPTDEADRDALREAVLSPDGHATPRPSSSTTDPDDRDKDKDREADDQLNMTPPAEGGAEGAPANPTLEALKRRIRELELESKAATVDKLKCLICMERYKKPAISICCWHVHCEQCWLHTLGAKKLCPQCNMITSPSDLRRIYL